MSGRLSTGVDALDDRLDGGIPTGSIVALSAAPASQSELFLATLTTTARTLYLTTERSESAVGTFLDRSSADPANCTVEKVDPKSPFEHVYHRGQSLPAGGMLVVDPMNPLEETDSERFWDFLNALQDQVVQRDSVALLHCIDGRRVPDHRDRTEYMADVVLELVTEFDGDSLENRLVVPKFRGGVSTKRALKLDLRREVSVDTSRDIA